MCLFGASVGGTSLRGSLTGPHLVTARALRTVNNVGKAKLCNVATYAVQQETGREVVWRPSLDDVQRISRGDAARQRGTGSRAVPHRLNADERKVYELAQQKGFLNLPGSGYRRERKGSPLANIWRQYCDARAQPCVIVAKGMGISGSSGNSDMVLVDLSTLRLADVSHYRKTCGDIAQQHGCAPEPDGQQWSPFTALLPPELLTVMLEDSSNSEHGDALEGGLHGAAAAGQGTHTGDCAEEAAEAAALMEPAAEPASPACTSSSSSGTSTRSSGASASITDRVAEQLAELRRGGAIWQHPPLLECFSVDRAAAKSLARQLAEQLRAPS